MSSRPETREVKYVRANGEHKTALIIPVDFPSSGLSQEELGVLQAISSAVNGLTPIYAQQQGPETLELFRDLCDLEKRLTSSEQKAMLDDYNTLFCTINAPYDYFNVGITLRINTDEVPEGHEVLKHTELFSGDFNIPKGRNLYPMDITESEFEELGELKATENSTVVRENGNLKVVLNEERFKSEIAPIIQNLEKAISISTNPDLKAYLGAKIDELYRGSTASRRDSDLAWLKNSGPIDFVIGTGVEDYLDKFKGVRGVAQGAVFVTDPKYEALSSKLLGLMPKWEAEAPWHYKKTVDTSNIPKLKYVNVFNWSGGYNFFPMVVAAQSLPNDKEIIDKHGSINLVFVNVQKALSKSGTNGFIAKELLLSEDVEKYLPHMPDMSIIETALHELGHTAGGSIITEDPHIVFKEEYTRPSEAKAELFSMLTLPSLVDEGVLNPELKDAGYYTMLTTLINSMQYDPVDHHGARNMMFNCLANKGAIYEEKENGKVKYALDANKTEHAVKDLLANISDIIATGDIDGLENLKSQYLLTDSQAYFKERLKEMPVGKGFIFPELEQIGGVFTGKLTYPNTFRKQKSTLQHFI